MQEIFEKVIEELKQESIITDDDAGHRAIEIIRQTAAEYNNGWIPCSERLPNREEYLENDGRFIVTDGNRRYQGLFDIYNDKFMIIQRRYRQNWSSPAEDKCVIAWQQLPELYQPEEEPKSSYSCNLFNASVMKVDNDLISRSAVMKLIESKCTDGCLGNEDITLIDAYGLLDDVSELPTAYDVENVVTQMDKLITESYYKAVEGSNLIVGYIEGAKNNAYHEALKIVKAGGTNET